MGCFPHAFSLSQTVGPNFWVSLCKYAVNLSGGQPQLYSGCYAVVERANDRKSHVFATKHKANTYSERAIHSHDDASI